jgi:hypothetical protein
MSSSRAKRPHWAWPHVVGVAIALVAYFAIYSVTGDSDLFIAIAAGATGAAFTYVWFYTSLFVRREFGHRETDGHGSER